VNPTHPQEDPALVDIHNLKTRAKNNRDDGDFERAIKFADEAIGMATDRLEQSDADRQAYARELADLQGLKGGIRRREALDTEPGSVARQELLARSRDDYDQGYDYEREVGLDDTYNLLNRLISRILLQPSALDGAPLDDEPQLEADGLRPALQEAADKLNKQLAGPRRTDPWALADAALVEVLLTDSPQYLSSYARLHQESPPTYVYESALSVLRPLANTCGDSRPQLWQAIADVERGLA